MESITRDKTIEHMESNNLLSECQHSFVAGRSCTTNLMMLDRWTNTKLLDSGTSVDTIYLDFAKAFVSVPHQWLLLKLNPMGLDHMCWHGLGIFWLAGAKGCV